MTFCTPAPTAAPTQVPTAAQTAIPYPTSRPDYSGAVPGLGDLPEGFQEPDLPIPQGVEDASVVAYFAFGNPRTGQIISGTTMLLSSNDLFSLKLIMSNPELLTEQLMGTSEIKEFTITETYALDKVGG